MTSKSDLIISVGKKKRSVARTRIKKGKGSVRVNSIPIELWGTEYERNIVTGPISYVSDEVKNIDADINVSGGGPVSQAAAIRVSFARGLVDFTGNKELREKLLAYDDKILSGDPRRKEPNKPGHSAARARRQKSYR